MPTYATVIGRLGRDPETKTVGKGTVTEFSVASDHGFGDRKNTSWIRVSCWGKSGEAATRFLKKGDGVICTGEIDLRTWDKPDGSKGYSLELANAQWTFPPGGKSDGGSGQGGNRSQGGSSTSGGGGYGGDGGGSYDDDQIPF